MDEIVVASNVNAKILGEITVNIAYPQSSESQNRIERMRPKPDLGPIPESMMKGDAKSLGVRYSTHHGSFTKLPLMSQSLGEACSARAPIYKHIEDKEIFAVFRFKYRSRGQ